MNKPTIPKTKSITKGRRTAINKVHPYRIIRPVMVHRAKKEEIDVAIKDLEARGYEVVHGPVQVHKGKKQFDFDEFTGRHSFEGVDITSGWAAQLRLRRKEDGKGNDGVSTG